MQAAHKCLVMTVQWLLLSRRRFSEMAISQSGMSTAQFIRLLLMAIIFAISGACSCIFQLIIGLSRANWSPYPFVSWSYNHTYFREIFQVQTVLLAPVVRVYSEVFYMFAPYAGVVFFVFFGLSGGVLTALQRSLGRKSRGSRQQKVQVDRRPRNLTNADPGPLCVHFSYILF